MSKHALVSQNSDLYIEWFDKFDAAAIKKTIIKHLKACPCDTIEHVKEYSKEDIKKFCGYQIVNFYEINPKSGCPSLVITRGNKTFYRKLTIE